jgi:DNA-binding CsgD family transcriptional regulator
MQDKRIEDHAQARGVSVTTVRTQLAHLFRKTGTNRQSELVRMASRAVGGLRVDDDEPGGRQDR